jgi:hypothetical protein
VECGDRLSIQFRVARCQTSPLTIADVCFALAKPDENVYEHCVNLFGVMKLALLKVTVGAIVVQGLIENLLYANGTIHGENSGLRAYCKC